MGIFKKLFSVAAACLLTVSAWAQFPQIWKYTQSDKSFFQKMSDNGQWMVTGGTTNNPAKARLINLGTKKTSELNLNDDIKTATYDVTNDGKIVVGSYDRKPAYWDAKNNKWVMLATPAVTMDNGWANAVTPDGRYAVGKVSYHDFQYNSVFWDLKNNTVIETPNLPDISYQGWNQIDFRGISPDGKKIWGHTSYFDFVYDVEKATFNLVGFKVEDGGKVVSKYDNYVEFYVNNISNNFKYFAGNALYYVAGKDESGADDVDFSYPFVYNTETDEVTIYTDDFAVGNLGCNVSNDGLLFIASPYGNAYRDWSVNTGKYWVSFDNIMKQLYSIDFKKQYEFSNTGTFGGIADDNQTTYACPDYWGGDGSYICKWPKPIRDVLATVKVLGSYTATPTEGCETSALSTVNLAFDRKIVNTSSSKSNTAILEDEDENVVARSIRFKADGVNLDIAFRNKELEEGKTYYVHIPANAIQMENDAEQTNADIYVEYKGRHQGPVKLVNVNPEAGGSMSRINVNTNPIVLTFDTDIKMDLKETRKALVYRGDETEPYAQLNFYYGDKRVVLAPGTAINLLKDNMYRIVVPAGVITDQGGNGANEEITITYQGAYEREISTDNENIFFNCFDNQDLYTAFMLFDGDKNIPTADMKSWGFTKSQPWWIARSDRDTKNYAGVSHSMYSPAGQSDDWLSTHQLYIPDANCTLEFQSQSYLKSANDYLKVYVWPCDRVYNSLTQDVVNKIKEEGVLVYNEKQDPGKEEESLEGDWKQNTVSLAQFAGKDVYVAFLNDNKNQSAVFIDSVTVKHNMHLLLGMDVEESVVDQNSITMKGVIVGNNKDKTYQDVTLTLKDEEGKVVDQKVLKNQNLSLGVRNKFEFDKQMPLKSGAINRYSVELSSEGESFTTTGKINNLLFAPKMHAVVEEFTGRDCPNCPLGILGMEKLEQRFGDQVIPVAIHGYTGDPLVGNLSGYCAYLGFSGAPSANINRKSVTYPAVTSQVQEGQYEFYFSAKELEMATGLTTDPLWQDVVEEELSSPAISEVSAKFYYDEAENKFVAPFEVKYALNATGQNVNIMGLVLEDNVNNVYQQNSMGGYTSSALGEWGNGGKYSGTYVTNYLCQDVCRDIIGDTYTGTGGLIPQSVEAGKAYTGTLSIAASSQIADINNCKMVVLMIDANTGKVINAVCAPLTANDPSGIHDVSADAKGETRVYNMQGMLVRKGTAKATATQGLHGLYIVNGKKVILK